MATLTITMSDTNPSGYVSYPGVILTTATAGISFPSDLGPPGALIDHTASKPVSFTLSFDASIPSGTSAAFKARAYGCPSATSASMRSVFTAGSRSASRCSACRRIRGDAYGRRRTG
jgi:hypothetical protein